MLPTSHKNILTNWSNLLQDFQKIITEKEDDLVQIQTKWQKIQDFLQAEIVPIHCHDLSISYQSGWQAWQTETYRYVRLLNTELSFWKSAQQEQTKSDRYQNIKERLGKMIQLTDNLWQSFDHEKE